MLNLSSFFIEKELTRRGYAVTPFYDNDLLRIEKSGKRFYTHASITNQQTTSYLICRDKYLTKEILKQFGFPTAKGVLLNRENISDVKNLDFPIALKPTNLSGGVGVSLHISTQADIEKYFMDHPEYTQVLAEEMFEGKDTRVLIVRGKFFAACQREPASIIGDGAHTIEEIITSENKRREEILLRQQRENVWDEDIFPILFDVDCKTFIRQSGYELHTTLENGKKIFVRSNSNVASGGSSVDVTDLVCNEMRSLCESIAEKIKMTTVGIDIMSASLSEPLEKQSKAGVVEINASPGLSLHILTHIGTRRNPVPLIVDEIEARMNT